MLAPPTIRKLLPEEEVAQLEGTTQKEAPEDVDMAASRPQAESQSREAGEKWEAQPGEGQKGPSEKALNAEQLKEQRQKLKERKSIGGNKSGGSRLHLDALDLLAKEVEKQIEEAAAPAPQPNPYNVYVKAVMELKVTEEARKGIQDRIVALKEELEAQESRLVKATLIEQAATKAVLSLRDAAGLAKRNRDPGEVQLEPEATLKMGGGPRQGQVTADTEAGSILTDLMERLEAGAFGFTQNPDGEYQEYVDQWELEHPEGYQSQIEMKMPPAEWAMRQVARHVKAMINKEPPPVKRARATDK